MSTNETLNKLTRKGFILTVRGDDIVITGKRLNNEQTAFIREHKHTLLKQLRYRSTAYNVTLEGGNKLTIIHCADQCAALRSCESKGWKVEEIVPVCRDKYRPQLHKYTVVLTSGKRIKTQSYESASDLRLVYEQRYEVQTIEVG